MGFLRCDDDGAGGLEALYGASVLAGGIPIFTTRTVHEIIWGYNDTQLEIAHLIE
jgi:hypothetical protein